MLASSSVEERRRVMEPEHPALPITRQYELLGLARASYYHEPEPESDDNPQLMRVIGETYLAYPCFGIPADDALAAAAGPPGEPQAAAMADAADGTGGELPEAEPVAEAP